MSSETSIDLRDPLQQANRELDDALRRPVSTPRHRLSQLRSSAHQLQRALHHHILETESPGGFLEELQQAGIFQITGYSAEEQRALVGSFCPGTLYPYAREAISSVVGKGGFPPLLLQPINFDALYAQAGRQPDSG